jgi:hypothetical protein
MGDALQGAKRPLIVTAGLAYLAPGRVATEHDVRSPEAPSLRASEQTATALAGHGVHTSVVRLPCVRGPGDRFTVRMLIDLARRRRMSAYVDNGRNRWAAVHSGDAALLYRRARERACSGACYHAVAEEAVFFHDIAEAIGRRAHVPVVRVASSEAADHFGPLAQFVREDVPAASSLTREWLGWEPHGPGLLADIEGSAYDEPSRCVDGGRRMVSPLRRELRGVCSRFRRDRRLELGDRAGLAVRASRPQSRRGRSKHRDEQRLVIAPATVPLHDLLPPPRSRRSILPGQDFTTASTPRAARAAHRQGL